jgi:hypothetical protein
MLKAGHFRIRRARPDCLKRGIFLLFLHSLTVLACASEEGEMSFASASKNVFNQWNRQASTIMDLTTLALRRG